MVSVGRDLPFEINEGLRSCRFGAAIISPTYLQKFWTKRELSALTSREEVEARHIVLPVLYGLDQSELAQRFPLWARAVSVVWNGDPDSVAKAIARTLGQPTRHPTATSEAAFEFAARFSREDLDIGPRHRALISASGGAVEAANAIWKIVQHSNSTFPKKGSEARKRAHALMLTDKIAGPAVAFRARASALEEAAEAYGSTLRNLLVAAESTRLVDSEALKALNETYSGADVPPS